MKDVRTIFSDAESRGFFSYDNCAQKEEQSV